MYKLHVIRDMGKLEQAMEELIENFISFTHELQRLLKNFDDEEFLPIREHVNAF